MSIATALGISEEKLFKTIPKERINHIGQSEKEMIETSSAEVQIFAKNEEDRKILEYVHNI